MTVCNESPVDRSTQSDNRTSPGLLRYDTVSAWAEEQREQGLTVGFTCGAFDILHSGHLSYLEEARRRCDRLIVAVNSDASVQAYKSPLRPIVGESHRITLVLGLRCVDAAIVMNETRPARLLELIKPNFYIKGGDYEPGRLRSAPLIESLGGRAVTIPVVHDVSTSSIISRIQALSLYDQRADSSRTAAGKIAFLDRDGTLIENVPFIRDPAEVRLLPGVPEGLKTLQDNGYRLVVVTNQQGLGLGYFDYSLFVRVNSEMLRQLGPFGIQISRFYYCPHTMADHCRCRKPGSELLERALSYFGAQACDCVMFGDSAGDLEAAQAAGCRGIRVDAQNDFASAVARMLTIDRQDF